MPIKCTRISPEAFKQMIGNAGVLLSDFDLKNPVIKDENIITATTGGITISCVESTIDFGEDIDNVPNNMKEFKYHDSWDSKFGFTALCLTLKTIQLALGAADIDEEKGMVSPRNTIKLSDFRKVYWLCNTIAGDVAVCTLENAYSTGGFNLKTEKNGKGQLDMELTGHTSIQDPDDPPMKFYLLEYTEDEVETLDDTPEEI